MQSMIINMNLLIGLHLKIIIMLNDNYAVLG